MDSEISGLDVEIAEFLITRRNSNPRARRFVSVPLFIIDNRREIEEIKTLLAALGVDHIPDGLADIPR
jgi:hypothetical protein